MVFDYCEFDLTGLQGYVKNKFTAAQVKCILLQLLKGLLYLASQGVLHRDLKAANILINAQARLSSSLPSSLSL
jgi:cyclin-dependent kinase 12/13